jgi:hypothetical protein
LNRDNETKALFASSTLSEEINTKVMKLNKPTLESRNIYFYQNILNPLKKFQISNLTTKGAETNVKAIDPVK